MKKICFFNSSNFWGGGEKLHLENAKAFRAKGYSVTIAAHPMSPLWERGQEAGFNLFPVEVKSISFLHIFKLLRIKSYFLKEEIDTVIFTTSQDAKIASIAGQMAHLPRRVYLRGLATPIKNSVVNRYCLGKATTHIIANSEETKRTILHYLHNTLDAVQIPVIYHGLDSTILNNAHEILPQIKELGKGVILGNAGRLTHQKCQKYLIQVAKKIKDQGLEFTLFIAGTGELHDELQQYIKDENLENEVILLGFVADMDVFMQSIDIFVLGSSWEGFGFVLVEAMAKEKPVVAFDITSNPEIITNGQTGLLAQHLDIDDFSNKLAQLIRDANLRQHMGAAAKQSVIDRFMMIDRITELEHYLLNH